MIPTHPFRFAGTFYNIPKTDFETTKQVQFGDKMVDVSSSIRLGEVIDDLYYKGDTFNGNVFLSVRNSGPKGAKQDTKSVIIEGYEQDQADIEKAEAGLKAALTGYGIPFDYTPEILFPPDNLTCGGTTYGSKGYFESEGGQVESPSQIQALLEYLLITHDLKRRLPKGHRVDFKISKTPEPPKS